jgi:hypothetical protein
MQGAGLALRNRLQHRLDVMRAIKAHLEAERERVQAILNPTQTEGDAT